MTKADALQAQAARALDTRALNLILLPTEKCNFRCTYCYEDFRLGVMPATVISGIKSLLSARAPQLDDLSIAWFGGEPLLATRVIFELCDFVRELQRAHPQLGFRSSMATNAHRLDGETLQRLAECGVSKFQITLDGPEEQHNQTRVSRKGQGTFAQIWRNLLGIRDSALGVEVTLRLHYQAHTYRGLLPLIDALNAEFAGDGRFRVHFKAVARLGGPNDREIQAVPGKDQAAIERELRARLRFPDQAVNLEGYVCYAGAMNSMVIRSNGEINKCTVAFASPANRIGRLNRDGSIDVEQEKFRRWVDALLTGDPGIMSCPLHYVLQQERQTLPERDVGEPVRRQALPA